MEHYYYLLDQVKSYSCTACISKSVSKERLILSRSSSYCKIRIQASGKQKKVTLRNGSIHANQTVVGDLQLYTTTVFPFNELAITYYINLYHCYVDLCMVVAIMFLFLYS